MHRAANRTGTVKGGSLAAEEANSVPKMKCKKHALVLPLLAQAHLFGSYRFALQIAKRGVTVTLLSSEKFIVLARTFDELHGLDFNLISYQDFGFEDIPRTGEVRVDTGNELITSRSRFQPVLEKLLADRNGGISGPTCIIADRFFTWVTDAAKELSIPYYQFHSCGGTHVRQLQALPSLFADGSLIIKYGPDGAPYIGEFEGYLKIPGLPPLENRDMLNFPPPYVHLDYLEVGRDTNKADAVIVNTFYELEAPPMDALQLAWKDVSPGKIPKLFLVGPLSTATNFRDRSLAVNQQGIVPLQWLDRWPPRSVVYICIGTVASLSPHQVEEIAQELEASEQSFLWVASGGVVNVIPQEFEARTRERGLVVRGWVPQLKVLQHPAIGGFVTHCGWNSIIESISSGVPMGCWPRLHNDQFLNCRYLVDVLKIAIEVRSRTPNSPGRHGGLEEAVRLLLSDEGNALRTRVQELKKKAEAAVANGGSSNKALNDLVESIPPLTGTHTL